MFSTKRFVVRSLQTLFLSIRFFRYLHASQRALRFAIFISLFILCEMFYFSL